MPLDKYAYTPLIGREAIEALGYGFLLDPLDEEDKARIRRREEREKRRQQEAAEEEATWEQLWASGEMGRYEDEEDEEEDKEEKDVSAEEKGAEEEQVAEDFSDIFGVPVEAQDGEKPHQWVRVGDEANKVPFAGCMVDRDLVLAAGLEETEEEELAALMVGYEQGPHGDKAAEG